jgi:hypothetical protein
LVFGESGPVGIRGDVPVIGRGTEAEQGVCGEVAATKTQTAVAGDGDATGVDRAVPARYS